MWGKLPHSYIKHTQYLYVVFVIMYPITSYVTSPYLIRSHINDVNWCYMTICHEKWYLTYPHIIIYQQHDISFLFMICFFQGACLLRLSTSQEELEHLGLRKATNLAPWKQWMPSSRGKNLQMASFSPVFSAKTDDTSKQGISMTEDFRFWANPKWSIKLTVY